MNKAVSAGILAICAGFGLDPLYAQAPPAANATPKAVLSQTSRGITITLSDIHWQSFEPTQAEYAWATPFSVQYDVKSDLPMLLPPGKSLLDYVTSIRLTAPDGTLIKRTGNGRLTGIHSELIKASASWEGADPRWPFVGIDVDLLDPDAPLRAAGQEEVSLTFPALPVPKMGETLRPVHAETVTPLGTRVIIEKISFLTDPELVSRYSWRKPEVLVFTFHAVANPKVPDMRFSFSSGITVTDSTGKTLNLGRGSINGSHLSGEEIIAGWSSVGVGDTPTPNAKTLTLTLPTTESSETLMQNAPLRHFHLHVPIDSSMFPPRTERVPRLVLQEPQTITSLDSLSWDGSYYLARLILRDRKNSKILWKIRALYGTDEAGNLLTGEISQHGPLFWKINQQPVTEGETAQEIQIGKPNISESYSGISSPDTAKSLILRADAEAFREQPHILDFSRIPVPTDGTSLRLNREVIDAFGGRLTLRSVNTFSSVHPLPPGFVRPDGANRVSAGMVVVLAEPPSLSGDSDVDYHLIEATDAAGRQLRPAASLNSDNHYALIGKSPMSEGDTARIITLFLLPAAPGAKTFDLKLGSLEQVDLHKKETLTFPTLPAPAR